MKKLLLHICCAPDATIGIERLTSGWDARGFFYNPNIHPPQEYDRRLAAMNRLSEATGFPFLTGEYNPGEWMVMVQGLEGEPEKGRRCEICIRDRLRRTAREARDGAYDAFAAVLTVSPHKNAAMVNRLGTEAALEYGVEYLPTDLKKMDGFKRSVQLSREMGIYRQDYCGCEFSRKREVL
ncbi:MAG: epoxyqueuosine reductase QueH [bacterium]|nr:epoxyqueuosine reductase QueH [bacterium]